MEDKNKKKVEMEAKDNEIRHLSMQYINFINQLTNANEEIMNLRSENERLQNDLNSKKKLNERIMKSQVDMNQLNEENLYRQKEKQEMDTKKKVVLQTRCSKESKTYLQSLW